MQFEHPLALLLLLTLFPLVYVRLSGGHAGGLRFSTLDAARGAPRTLRTRLRHLPLMLRVAALALAVVALARPRAGVEQIRESREGVAIQMVLDRSGSMAAEMDYDGQKTTRLEVVKRVFRDFVMGSGRTLRGRPNDLVGMVTFARYADTICPLTLSHGAALRFLGSVHLVTSQAEDGTAIGDALALAAARLESATVDAKSSGYRVASKVIILLTDGIHNAGRRTPAEAARLAATWGIRIHTIGMGGGSELTTLRGGAPAQIDRDTLEEIARIGGGIFRDATDAAGLRQVYAEIDRMERSPLAEVRYAGHRELFGAFGVAALLLLVAEALLTASVLRRLP